MQQELEINHETAHDAPAGPASSGPGLLIIAVAVFLAVFILGPSPGQPRGTSFFQSGGNRRHFADIPPTTLRTISSGSY